MRPCTVRDPGSWILRGLGDDQGAPAPDISVVQGPDLPPELPGQANESGLPFVMGSLAFLFFLGGWRTRPAYERIRVSQRQAKILGLRQKISDLEKE
jgi:hypothetical protein